MSAKIFGREREIKILDRLYRSKKPEFLALYGRRRVGKTYLIHEFFKDKGVYFTITGSVNSSKKLQLRKFYLALKEQLLYSGEPPRDWDEALHNLKKLVSSIDSSKKVIIFLDELPWLAANRSGFIPALEYIWNQYFSKMDNILLIVCGSAANWIIKKIINNKGGLYGRLSEIIKLNPFTLEESEKFLLAHQVNLSKKQLAELYMCIGGIAKYLTYIKSGNSVVQTINELCFTPQGNLVGEFNNLYSSLFKDHEKHIQIIRELSSHKQGMTQKEILKKLKLPSGGRSSSILRELEESGFITGYLEYQKNTKEKKFWLVDEYSYFYLTWIEKVKEGILLGSDPNYWMKMHSEPAWKTWSGYAFESLCLKHIRQIKKALGISAVLTSESQWTHRPKSKNEKGAQIDLVIDRKDDCINLCEIKFSNTPFTIDQNYAEELERKISVFREQTKTNKAIFLTLITPFGLHMNEHAHDVHAQVILNDLFSPLND